MSDQDWSSRETCERGIDDQRKADRGRGYQSLLAHMAGYRPPRDPRVRNSNGNVKTRILRHVSGVADIMNALIAGGYVNCTIVF